MSFLAKVEDWVIRHTLKPLQPWQPWQPIGHPSNDDMMISLLFFAGIVLGAGCTIGYYLAKQ